MTTATRTYYTSLNQRTGDAQVIAFDSDEVVATYLRADHGDRTLYAAQDHTFKLNSQRGA